MLISGNVVPARAMSAELCKGAEFPFSFVGVIFKSFMRNMSVQFVGLSSSIACVDCPISIVLSRLRLASVKF